MKGWYDLHITDKTGKKFFNTTCTSWGVKSEYKNLSRHIEQAKKYPHMYKFLDIETAEIIVKEGE